VTDPFAPPDPNQPPPAPQPPAQPWPQPAPPPWQQPSPWPTQQSPWPQQPPPWPTQPWYGAPPARTNGLAIAALVTGIIGLVPIAIGLGIAALVQIKKRGEGGRGLAIGGIGASGAWVLLLGLLFSFSGVDGFGYSRQGDLAEVASTQVGDCLTADPSGVIDCSTPHDFEIYYTGDIPRADWPGTSKVDDIAKDICFDTFDDYVGTPYYDSEYDYTFYAPSEVEWGGGLRTVVCVVTPAGEYLTGSVKGSGA
jgi:hypothetical protein